MQATQPDGDDARAKALQLAVTLIGGIILARALDDAQLSEELIAVCREYGLGLLEPTEG